jgi:hypothetical protein
MGRARDYLAVITTAFLVAMQHIDFIGVIKWSGFFAI